MVLCNTGKPHCRKASWARPTYNSIGIMMQRQEACSAVSIASPHKPLLVVKRVLKRLASTAWLSLIKWPWGSTVSRQCSLETRLTHDPWQSHFVIFGISQESFMAFSKEVWSISPGPYALCLSRFSDISLPLLQPKISHLPCCQLFLNISPC